MIAINSKHYIQILYLFTLVFALTACGGGSDGGASNTPVEPDTTNTPAEPEIATAMIGTAGGTIVTPGGMVSVTIPAGALTEEQEITVELLDGSETPDPYSTTGEMAGDGAIGVKFSPDGLVFATPIEVTIVSPNKAVAAEVDSFKGFTIPLLAAVLISEDGAKEALTNPVVNLNPATGVLSLTAQISHFSTLPWVPYESRDGNIPATVDILGFQDTLAVGSNIALVALAHYGPGIFDQLSFNLTDQSIAPFNLISAAGTFPLFPDAPQVSAYTCAEVGTGTYKAKADVDITSIFTTVDPFAFDTSAPQVTALNIGGKLVPAVGLNLKYTFEGSVDCIAKVSDSGGDTDGGNFNDGTPSATALESFTGVISATEVLVGETFTVTTEQTINPLFFSSLFATANMNIFTLGNISPVELVSVESITGGGSLQDNSSKIFNISTLSEPLFAQRWTFVCSSEETDPIDMEFNANFLLVGILESGGEQDIVNESVEKYLGSIVCVAPTTTGTKITGTPDVTVELLSSANVSFEVDASELDGAPSTVEISADALLVLGSIIDNLRILPLSKIAPPLKQSSFSLLSNPIKTAAIGTPITNGISYDSTPTNPFDVIVLDAQCVSVGVGNITASLKDESGAVLASDSVQVTCELPPTSAACINATNGLETGFECNVGAGTVEFANVFQPTIDDVPIGGAAGQTVPGGITLYLPLANSGDVANEANFALSGWDGSNSPPATPVPTLFGLDANHQYLFVQYENGVDLIDLSTPDAPPLHTGLLDFSGREQVAESNVEFVHDYMVMPVHTATDDYLIGCGVDVVRHNFDSTANAGNGDFDAAGVIVSDGTELCRDIWTDVDGDGVAPGFAYTTKTVSKSLKTTKWVEAGSADVTMDGDWEVQGSVGLDDNNRIQSGVGGFFGEGALMGSRGIGESGLWFGPRGNAVPGSIIKVSSETSYEHVRCAGALCVAASDGVSITSLLWPDHTVAPSVADSSSNFSSLSPRNMVEANNGNLYQFNVTSSDKLAIGQVSSTGDISGPLLIDISTVCTDPQEAQILDMNHIGILCRNDNLFKVLEFVQE